MTIAAESIHIWSLNLDLYENEVRNYERLLDTPELSRAARFISPNHRQRFTIAHGFLRKILASYLDLTPESITFTENHHGKPALSHDHNCDLTFNLSHSDTQALYGVSLKNEIGVDIELMRENYPENIIPRIFSPQERYEFGLLSNKIDKVRHFYTLWCKKEAILKALGIGLSYNLQDISVSGRNPTESITLNQFGIIDVHSFEIPHYPGFCAAVARLRSQRLITSRIEVMSDSQESVFASSIVMKDISAIEFG